MVVYRSECLPISETFIAAQVRSMKRYVPHLFSVRTVRGIALDGFACTTLTNGQPNRMSELLFRYCGRAPQLMRAAAEIKPALLHAHFALDATEALPIVEGLKLPFIVTLHGFDVSTDDRVFLRSWSGRRFLSKRNRLKRRASLFLCVSHFIRDVALKRGFPPEKLRIHHIGVDTNVLLPATEAARNESEVLFVGRLVEKKGLTHLIRAMQIVRDAFPKARLVVIGDGPLRARHEREASELGVTCEFRGALPQPCVVDQMQRSSVLVVPSVTARTGDREGLGMVICEAFALGLPVIGFRSGGIPEVITRESGLLSPEGDYRGLAENLQAVLRSRDLRHQLSLGARQLVVEKFDLKTQTRTLEELYDEVVDAHRERQHAAR